MKIIKSTNGYRIKVDNEDFEWLNQWRWQAVEAKNGKRRVRRQFRENGKMKHVSMHRVVMKAKKGKVLDHVNGDQLDNRKFNLRFCTIQQNNWNTGISKRNTSGLKGATYAYSRYRSGGKMVKVKRKKPWLSQFSINGKNHFLGYYKTAKEAHKKYVKMTIKHHGEFCFYN